MRAEADMPRLADRAIPSRPVPLPLSWDDPATRLAIEKYTTTVRPDAPRCPSNIEFSRRINGLASIEDVRRIVYNASYLVLGHGTTRRPVRAVRRRQPARHRRSGRN